MQAGGALFQQAFAQGCDNVFAKGADGVEVLAPGLQSLADPARDFSTTVVGETRQLEVVGNRHDAGDDRYGDAGTTASLEETEIGVSIVKILGNRTVGTGFHLAPEILQVPVRAGGLWMVFRVGSNLDV